jgi:hypothetical protein
VRYLAWRGCPQAHGLATHGAMVRDATLLLLQPVCVVMCSWWRLQVQQEGRSAAGSRESDVPAVSVCGLQWLRSRAAGYWLADNTAAVAAAVGCCSCGVGGFVYRQGGGSALKQATSLSVYMHSRSATMTNASIQQRCPLSPLCHLHRVVSNADADLPHVNSVVRPCSRLQRASQPARKPRRSQT